MSGARERPMVVCETCEGMGKLWLGANDPFGQTVVCWDCRGEASWEANYRCSGCDAIRPSAIVAYCQFCEEQTETYIG